jgi:hypothetical protein
MSCFLERNERDVDQGFAGEFQIELIFIERRPVAVMPDAGIAWIVRSLRFDEIAFLQLLNTSTIASRS